ncbi:hypothetical protein C7458_105336 [Williamsia muralis]|nr:hypothetical protein C7458_105336 [Williamsia marianensis]
MNHGPAVGHRFTVGLIGILLVAAGVAAIGWRLEIDSIRQLVSRIDLDAPQRAADGRWWPAMLAVFAIIALLWGASLVLTAVRTGKIDDIRLTGSDSGGSLTIPPKLLASSVADDLRGQRMLDRVKAVATDDRGRKLIRITVTAQPHCSYDEIAAVVEDSVESIRVAVDGADLRVQALLHMENNADNRRVGDRRFDEKGEPNGNR